MFPDRLSRSLGGPMSESVDVNLNNVGVGHNEEARRFELYINGLRALLTYRLSLDRIVLLHTEVPQSLEGQGLARSEERRVGKESRSRVSRWKQTKKKAR